MEQVQKIGRFRKSWLLTKGAWRSIMLDKSLLALPFIGLGFSLLTLAPIIALFVINPGNAFYHAVINGANKSLEMTPIGVMVIILAALMQAIISSVLTGALTHGAIERFKGNDPNIQSSVKAAFKRFSSLTRFTVFSFTIGFIISEIANRIPFLGGRIVLWLAGSAWNIASFFAIPVIVTSDQPLGPIRATKKSTAIIKQVWGESLILSVGIGLVAALGFLAYIVLSGMLIGLSAGALGSAAVSNTIAVIAALGLFGGIILISVVQTYVKASVYYYATTGISPVTFDSQLLRQAFTAKKARKLFAR